MTSDRHINRPPIMPRPLLALVLVAILAGCIHECSMADCDCSYHTPDFFVEGCVIKQAPPAGFKCRCRIKGFWSLYCSGSAFPCVGGEKCYANQADYCACKRGGGDCVGYYKHMVTTCDGSGGPKQGVSSSATCDCKVHPGGCTTYKAAPFGWKCVCEYFLGWNCYGWAQQCEAIEICLGDDYSYCGCKQGGGDCGGYIDKPSCNWKQKRVSTSCNCNKASDWSKGLYAIDKVNYDLNNIQIHSMQPVALAQKEIPNHSGQIQTIQFSLENSMSRTSSFSHTRGIMIAIGMEFEAGIPFIGKAKNSITVTGSYQHTIGKSDTVRTAFKSTFTCNGSPYKKTKCTVFVLRAKATVPYTIMLKHKIIPDCTCKSEGVWTGVQAYNARLHSMETEN